MNKKRLVSILLVLFFLVPYLVFSFDRQDSVFELANIHYAHENGITGKGVKVAVIDTSFVDLPELNLKEIVILSPYSDKVTTHGTAVASIVRRIAPDAEIYALAHGGSWWTIFQALEWCLENDIEIINMSIGNNGNNNEIIKHILQPAMDKLYETDVVMVASAGNAYFDAYYPASFDGVYAVSGVDYQNGKIINVGYNNADWIDLTFLGKMCPVLTTSGNVGYSSGTSCSSPAVAGMFALLKQEYPQATKNELFDLLTENGITTPGIAGVFPVYPKKEEPKPDNPKPEDPPVDIPPTNDIEEQFNRYMRNKQRLNDELLDLLMDISKIQNVQVRETWLRKVIGEG